MTSQSPPSYTLPQRHSTTSTASNMSSPLPSGAPPSYTSTLPSITPVDPTYRTHSTISLVLHALLSATILNSPLPSSPVFYRVIATWACTIVTFNLLTSRYITLERACALRLVLNKPEFDATLANRTVLSQGGMSTIYRILVATSLLSSLPQVYLGLTKGGGAEWVRKVEGGVGWWFAVVNLVVCGVCWWMVLTQEGMKVEFDQKERLRDEDIPLKRWERGEEGEWKRVAGTSRRHDIWVRLLSKNAAVDTFEMVTRLATNHPLYSPEKEKEARGQVLRINLP